MPVYDDLHSHFLWARGVANALNELDPTINPLMASKLNRLNYINKLDEAILRDIKCPQCRLGELCNTDLDPVYVCPANPMKHLIEQWVGRYIGNPWPQDVFYLNPIQLKIMILGLSSPALGILAPRGVGKSVALALIAIMWCFFCAKGEDVFIVAPSTEQTEKVYQYVCDFMEAGKGNMLINGDPSVGYAGIKGNPRWGQKPEIEWGQGTLLRPRCASHTNHGKTMRGQQPTFEIIDESSYINDEIYYRTLKAGLVSNRGDHANIIVESGTPDVKNHFFDLFFDKAKFGHYTAVKFDFEDGLRYNRYSRANIDKVIAECGGYDSEEFKSEYRCIFPQTVTNFFRDVDYAFSNGYAEADPMPGMHYMAGLDLGRINDSTVLTIGRYEVTDNGDRIDVVHIMELHPSMDLSYPEQYDRIINELKKWNVQTCYVDYTGPGIPIFESLNVLANQTHCNTVLLPFSFQGANKYSEFMRLRGLMQTTPLPRIRYPNTGLESMQSHPDINQFLKANSEFKDIIQKRTGSATEASKYRVEPSKNRGHDDYVASCICLIKGITDNFNNEIVIRSQNRDNKQVQSNQPNKRMGVGVGGRSKSLSTSKSNSIWRNI